MSSTNFRFPSRLALFLRSLWGPLPRNLMKYPLALFMPFSWRAYFSPEGAPRPEEDSEASVVILLTGPLAEPSQGSLKLAAAAVGGGRKAAIRRQQDDVERSVMALGGTVTHRFDTLLNALVARIPLPLGFRALDPEGYNRCSRNHYRPQLASSVPFIGTPALWKHTKLGSSERGDSDCHR